jgi:GDP-4-dehydro-6-deoxy-D-mannose reductase
MKEYANKYSLNIVMARIFNVFGTLLDERYYLGQLEKKIKKICEDNTQEKLIIYNIIRDYSPCIEIIRKLIKIMIYGEPGQIYNVGSGTPRTMNQITEDFMRLYDYEKISQNLILIAQDNRNIPKEIVSDNSKFIEKFGN